MHARLGRKNQEVVVVPKNVVGGPNILIAMDVIIISSPMEGARDIILIGRK